MATPEDSAPAPGHDEVVAPDAGEVVLHHGLSVIETSTEADLLALLSDPRLAPLVLARVGACAALVLPGAASRLLIELKRSGRSPTVTGGP